MSEADPTSSETLDQAARLLVENGLLAVAVARAGVIVAASRAFCALFRITLDQVKGLPVHTLAAAADQARVAGALEVAIACVTSPGGQPERVELAFDATRGDGTLFVCELVATAGMLSDGAAAVFTLGDLSSRGRVERPLSYLAFLDPLTSLPNRALFYERLREAVQAARRDGRAFALMLCDADGFERINDTLGHKTAGAVLQAIACRLENEVPSSDTVARLGGGEFAVLSPGLDARKDALPLAEALVRACETPVIVNGVTCKVTLSVGIACFRDDGTDAETLVARAESAMYASKRAGKGQIAFASPARLEPPRPFLEWQDAHAIGVPLVDAQHKTLMGLVNQLATDLEAARGRDAILTSLRVLVSFTLKHFATEERLMAEHPGYAQEAAHSEEHRKLVEALTMLTVDIDARTIERTMTFLQKWLLEHIDVMDKPFGAWLKERGVE